MQLQRQLDQFSTQPRRAKLPESLWEAAVELARQHGVYSVAQPLRLDYMGLKKRLGEPSGHRRRAARAAFVELITPPSGDTGGVRHRVRVLARGEDAHPVEGVHAAGLGQPAARLAGNGRMIQITPQMRILVAVESVDFRKGIDSLAELSWQKLDADPFSGYLFVFRSRRATSIRVVVYDGQGFWLATKRLSKGRFRWWPRMTGVEEPARVLRAHQAQVLLAAGNPDIDAAPVWRKVS